MLQNLIDLYIVMTKWKPIHVKHSMVKKGGFIDRWIQTKKSWVRKNEKGCAIFTKKLETFDFVGL